MSFAKFRTFLTIISSNLFQPHAFLLTFWEAKDMNGTSFVIAPQVQFILYFQPIFCQLRLGETTLTPAFILGRVVEKRHASSTDTEEGKQGKLNFLNAGLPDVLNYEGAHYRMTCFTPALSHLPLLFSARPRLEARGGIAQSGEFRQQTN